MSIRELTEFICAPHDVPEDVATVCRADPSHEDNWHVLMKLHDAIVDLFRRSGAPTSGFPYHRNERAKRDHQELYDFIDVVVCQICRCFRQEAHMSTVLAAILYVRRLKPLQSLGKESCANINRLADLVLLSSLMLADMWVNEFPASVKWWGKLTGQDSELLLKIRREFLELIDYRCFVHDVEFAELCREVLLDLTPARDDEPPRKDTAHVEAAANSEQQAAAGGALPLDQTAQDAESSSPIGLEDIQSLETALAATYEGTPGTPSLIPSSVSEAASSDDDAPTPPLITQATPSTGGAPTITKQCVTIALSPVVPDSCVDDSTATLGGAKHAPISTLTLPEIPQLSAAAFSSPDGDHSSAVPDVCALAVGDNVSAVNPRGDGVQAFAGGRTLSLSLRLARRKRVCPYARPTHDESKKALGTRRQTARQVQAARTAVCKVHRDDRPQPDSKAAGRVRSWMSSAILLTMGVLCLLATTIALC